MPRETKRDPAINPPDLGPGRKPPVPPEVGARPTVPEGGPSQPEAGAPRPEPVATREDLSVEKLKADLFDREVPGEYEKIIVEFHGFESSDAKSALRDGLMLSGEEMRAFLKEKICGETVFDFGCGSQAPGRVVGLDYEAARYIGIDSQSLSKLPRYATAAGELEGVEFHYFGSEDILSFVSKLKDRIGGVYLMSSIEPYIPRNKTISEMAEIDRRTDMYYDALAKEMSRTLQSGDIVILTGASYDFFEHLGPGKYGFRRVNLKSDPGIEYRTFATQIYEKI